MHSTRLIRLTKAFSESDWSDFDKYLLSHYSKNTDLPILYRYISKYKENLDHPKLSLNYAHKKLAAHLPKKSFQNNMSRLVKEIEKFFIEKQLKSREFEREFLLLEAYSHRGLYKDFDVLVQRMKHKIRGNPKIDPWLALKLLNITHAQFFSDNPIKYRIGKELLQAVQYHLDTFYEALSSYYTVSREHFGKLINKNIHELSSDQIEQEFQYQKNRTLSFLQRMLDLVQHDTIKNYKKLRDIFLRDHIHLQKELSSSALVLLTNRAAGFINKGKKIYPEDLLELHLIGLNQDLYLVNNNLGLTKFINIINVACACEQFSLAEDLVEKYGPLVHKPHRYVGESLAQSEIHLWKGDYDDSVDLIRDLPSHGIYINLTQRTHLLRAYALSYDPFDDFIQSCFKNYDSFLYNNRDKISKKNYESSLHFSHVFKKLIQSDDDESSLALIQKTNNIKHRSWLRHQIKKRRQ